MRIIYLEDDPAQMELVMMWLERANFICQHFSTAKGFLANLKKETYDIAIMDWELPDMTGDEILSTLRETLNIQLPLICTTVRDQEENIVKALKLGADDYMTKPIACGELLARLEALARRDHRINQDEVFESPPYIFNNESSELTRFGELVALTDKEYLLAKLLFLNVGRMLSRKYLLETVWGTRGDLDTRTVDTHVSRIRKKLELNAQNGWRLMPVYKFGYRLEKISADKPA